MSYYLRDAERVAIAALEKRQGLKVLILEGAPGTGKTALSEYLAERWQSNYFYYLCHHWTSDEEMFINVNVGKVAAGVHKPEDAYEYGILSKVAIASRDNKVVLCLDELDKAPQRAESLLLDFLQHGRVYLPSGDKIQGELANMVVIITTNAVRPLMEATLRRGFRIKMEFLPPNVEADIIRKQTGAKINLIRAAVRMAGEIRVKGATAPSLQEIRHLVEDMAIATSANDVKLLILGWLCKEPEDWQALENSTQDPHKILWGEYKR